jgi:tRNA-dihydrouridine synthase C
MGIMLTNDIPALLLAPMDGVTDAAMRAVQGEIGAFTFAVTEFIRVSQEVPPTHVFHKHVPELLTGGVTCTGLPVQIQLLGGDPERMARAAVVARSAGATSIDINFGCPAPTVNRHDGGATLLKFPCRIREVVAAVRYAVPADIPVSAKMRLGWDTIDSIYENAAMAEAGGASWVTIHGRTRVAGYQPPIFWRPIGEVRERLSIPVVANGDIWTIEDFRRCREETGSDHFMLGRGALANPLLPLQAAQELGLRTSGCSLGASAEIDWPAVLSRLVYYTERFEGPILARKPHRIKQWLKLAANFGQFKDFESVKRAETADELLDFLADGTRLAA